MPAREGPIDVGAASARSIVANLAGEIRQARLDRGLTQADVGRAVCMSHGWVSRLERGLAHDLTIRQASLLLAAVGLRLRASAYPGGPPIRDEAHAALLERMRARLHRSLRWATEVPLPIPGDLRAWDATIRGGDWIVGVEAETRPRDLQALTRRVALKKRDGGIDLVLLVLLDSRHNRTLLREVRPALTEAFPTDGRRALELLGAGVSPSGSAIVML
jgi:transcriptional regulator with XRE-family HTH domain